MQKNTNTPFYLQWLCVAFTHSLGASDLVGAIIGVIAYFVYDWLGTLMIDVTLWIVIGILGGIVFIRLSLAPYWIYKKQKETIDILSQKVQSKTIQEIFVIESYGYEFGTSDTEGYPQLDVRRIARIDLLIHALPATWVEDIQLKILNNLIGTDWHPYYVGGGAPSGGYYYFGIPDSIKAGIYNVKLIGYAEGKTPESKPFEIEVPD